MPRLQPSLIFILLFIIATSLFYFTTFQRESDTAHHSLADMDYFQRTEGLVESPVSSPGSRDYLKTLEAFKNLFYIPNPKQPLAGKVSSTVIMPEMGNDTIRAELGRATWRVLHTMAVSLILR